MHAGDREVSVFGRPPLRAAVFLDRDDTLIVNREITGATPHPGDLYDPALVRLLPGVARGLREIGDSGFLLICVTNQGSIARGHAAWGQVIATNRRVREVISEEAGLDLDALYFCPYHPHGTVAPWNTEHPWRKPHPGMFLQAARDFKIDMARSWMIGDAERDIESALAAGIPAAHTIIVGQVAAARAGHRASDFTDAASLIVSSARP